MEVAMTFILAVLSCICGNDLIVVFFLTLACKLLVAGCIKDIHISTTYLYTQLVLVTVSVVVMVIGSVIPEVSTIANGVMTVVYAFINTNAMTETEYQEWLDLFKRIVVTDDSVIIYLKG